MSTITLKSYQDRAVASAVEVFAYMKCVLDEAGDTKENRETAIHDNGYVLIEAPTGSGKTLMAGHVVERVSKLDNVIWFWFAPFKGVVDQSAAFLREQFQGLRLRTMTDDRNPIGSKSGDVFVTTWGLVATRVRDRRSVRQTGEQNESVDELVQSLREADFRIGVVVDEAHHGFHGDTQAAVFFRTVLKPEYTVLITATPDDQDLLDLKERMQIGNIHKVSLGRSEAMGSGDEEGLIKRGVRAIAWRAEEGSTASIDFEKTALQAGAYQHRVLKAELAQAGINLVPLMLVQVDSSKDSVERAKAHLLTMGFTESQIAVHTAAEPDAGLLALANDESREVLIFKMAVALGFDAPRAWTLVSMRAAQDEDFGVQLVGRLLRVHRRLQGRVVPQVLRYGYVMLADIEAQGGLDSAGQRINRIKTQYATVSPTTVIVMSGTTPMVQSAESGGQLQICPTPPKGSAYQLPPDEVMNAIAGADPSQAVLFQASWAPTEMKEALRKVLSTPPPKQDVYTYPLKPGVPRQFNTQELPEDRDVTAEECAEHFIVEADQLWEAIIGRDRVKVEKRTLEIFTGEVQMELGFALPSLEEMAKHAYRILTAGGYFSAKDLRKALNVRLQRLLAERGVADADDAERVSQYLNVLLSQYPKLLREAQKRAMAAKAEVFAASPLPEALHAESPLESSRLNIYGRYPEKLNTWEREFAEYLDADDTQVVQWWHRNEPRKPWSINVLLESGEGFFPDFIIGIKNRPRVDEGLLADTKYAFETRREMPKLLAEHESYGRVIILTKNNAAKWAIAEIDPKSGSPRVAGAFQVSRASGY